MVVTLGLDVGVSHQEHRQDDGDDIPAREDQAVVRELMHCPSLGRQSTYVNVSATEPILSGKYQLENATIAGIWSRQTCRAYAEPISILNLS